MGGLASLLRICEHVSQSKHPVSDQQYDLLTGTMDSISLVLSARGSISLAHWDASTWMDSILSGLQQPTFTASAFASVTAVIQALFELSQFPLTPKLNLDRFKIINSLVDALLLYLDPQLAACHSESVRLIWLLQSLTDFNLVESILSNRMCSKDAQEQRAAYEAFGVIWRLSGQCRTENNLVAKTILQRTRTCRLGI
jgi:hypothetical protein